MNAGFRREYGEMVEKTDMCADNAPEHTVMEVSNNAIRFRCFLFPWGAGVGGVKSCFSAHES